MTNTPIDMELTIILKGEIKATKSIRQFDNKKPIANLLGKFEKQAPFKMNSTNACPIRVTKKTISNMANEIFKSKKPLTDEFQNKRVHKNTKNGMYCIKKIISLFSFIFIIGYYLFLAGPRSIIKN